MTKGIKGVAVICAMLTCFTGCSTKSGDTSETSGAEVETVVTVDHDDSFMRVKNPDGKKQNIVSVNGSIVKSAGDPMIPEPVEVETVIETETVVETDEEGNEVTSVVEVSVPVNNVEDTTEAEDRDENYEIDPNTGLRIDNSNILYTIGDNFVDIENAVDYSGEEKDISNISVSMYTTLLNISGGIPDDCKRILYAMIEAIETNDLNLQEVRLNRKVMSSENYEYEVYSFDTVYYDIKIAMNVEDRTKIKYLVTEKQRGEGSENNESNE